MIDVCWPSYHAATSRHGSWDMALLEDITGGPKYVHRNTFDEVPAGSENVIVVLPGQHHADDIDRFNIDISRFSSVVLCLVGDEESLFDTSRLNHPNLKLWIQSRRTLAQDRASHFIPWGYTQETRKYLPGCSKEKTLDWFFSGQVTHVRRQQCTNVLRRLPNGVLNHTPGFTQGFSREEYYRFMAKTKLAICPAGYITPDSFRIWEALEAGCIPIVDGMTPQPERCGVAHWWNILLGEEPPFPVVYDWNDLPRVIDEQLQNWEYNAMRIHFWWENYKQKLGIHLFHDATGLR